MRQQDRASCLDLPRHSLSRTVGCIDLEQSVSGVDPMHRWARAATHNRLPEWGHSRPIRPARDVRQLPLLLESRHELERDETSIQPPR